MIATNAAIGSIKIMRANVHVVEQKYRGRPIMNDGLVLMYCKNGTIYPVALTDEQDVMLQFLVKVFEPLRVIDMPQGKAIDLAKEANHETKEIRS